MAGTFVWNSALATWVAETTGGGGGGGTVTSVGSGTGLSGGPITGAGTLALTTPVAVANGGTGAANLNGLVTAAPGHTIQLGWDTTGHVTANIDGTGTPGVIGPARLGVYVTGGPSYFPRAGEIGELLQPATPSNVSVAYGPVGSSVYTLLLSTPVSAGDWDVGAQFGIAGDPTQVGTYLAIGMYLSTAPLPTTPNFNGTINVIWMPWEAGTFQIGTCALRNSTPVTMYQVINCWTDNPADVGKHATVSAWMHFRRMG
jgi:hypothetical protein